MTTERLPNIHPGEICRRSFSIPWASPRTSSARDIRVPANRINAIVRGQRTITADTALRLAMYFGTSAEFWLGLQMDYDLEEQTLVLADELERITPAAAETELEDEPQDVVASAEVVIEAHLEVTGEGVGERPASSDVHSAFGASEHATLDEVLATGLQQGWMHINGDLWRRWDNDYVRLISLTPRDAHRS